MKPRLLSVVATTILGLFQVALAHGDDDMNMNLGMGSADLPKPDPDSYPPTYFALIDHAGVIYAHIGIMVLAWVFVLPAAVMLSLARSRYTLPVQFLFLSANALGVLLGAIYNASTPDLYPNNAHHKLGWIVTWVASSQVVIGLLSSVVGTIKGRGSNGRKSEREFFMPISTAAMEEHQRLNETSHARPYRLSNDSGQGTEPNTESLRSHSVSTAGGDSQTHFRDVRVKFADEDDNDNDNDEDADLEADVGPLRPGRSPGSVAGKLAGFLSSRTWVWRIIRIGYAVIDRVILILGFIALCTGIITYGRFFEGHQVFTGLAHWIKGGIFFWLGIFTLGRWSGSFGELGWAWNLRPKQENQKWRPSAEFVESALIFTYGSSNIFLEHLGNWGKGYSAEDLEHISITILFIGGGLCGMLVESSSIRDLLNTTVTETASAVPVRAYREEERRALELPKHYGFSINPIPALVILLLGIMMSSHTQSSMISSMVHKQWGNLLAGASFARGFTYILVYLRPPRSILPSRPPTELLASFGLISGGIIFMASSGDTIDGMIHYNLDAMFMYTVTMGFVGLLMAWVVLMLALKGWAVRREAGRPASHYGLA